MWMDSRKVVFENVRLFTNENEGVSIIADEKLGQQIIYAAAPPLVHPIDLYAAYEARITALTEGARYVLAYSDEMERTEYHHRHRRIDECLQIHLNRLREYRKKIPADRSPEFGAELYHFYSVALPDAAKLTPKQIALGEAFYVWQHVGRKTRTTQYTQGHLVITQEEFPRVAYLTPGQEYSIQGIYHDEEEQPKWFRKLESWAQVALKDIARVNYENYQKPRPTTLRCIPGEANATRHKLTIHNKESGEILSQTVSERQAVPTSFSMRDRVERQYSANGSLMQLFGHVLLDTNKEEEKKAVDRFSKCWQGLSDFSKIPVISVGLLNAEKFKFSFNFKAMMAHLGHSLHLTGEQNNQIMAREKAIAFEKVTEIFRSNFPEVRFEFFNFEIAVNGHRLSKAVPDKDFKNYLCNFIERISSLIEEKVRDSLPGIVIAADNKSTVREESKAQLSDGEKLEKRLYKLKQIYTALESFPTDAGERNQNIFLAALYDVAVRSMGGVSTGNCHKSKDRKAVALMMADAILIYQEQYDELPSITDTGLKRENFITILCHLYASGHHQLIAHDNSLGAAGIKDPGIFDKDIIQRLGDVYRLSCINADFNKPGTWFQKYKQHFPGMKTAILGALCLAGGILLGPVGIPLVVVGGCMLVAAVCVAIKNKIEDMKYKRQTFSAQFATFSPLPAAEEEARQRPAPPRSSSALVYSIPGMKPKLAGKSGEQKEEKKIEADDEKTFDLLRDYSVSTTHPSSPSSRLRSSRSVS